MKILKNSGFLKICTNEMKLNVNSNFFYSAIKSVRLGSIDLDNYHEASKKIVRITNFYSHPMYGFIRNSKQNDIGLLELERDMVKFNGNCFFNLT